MTTTYSHSRREESRTGVDLCFNLAMSRIGLMQWERFDSIVEQGFQHAQAVLFHVRPELLAKLGAR